MNAGFRFPVPDLRSKVRFDWNDEHVAALRKFAAQKMSATEIKNALGGGVTRSAVLGKAMRIGVKIDSGARGLARPKGRGGEPLPAGTVKLKRALAPPKPPRATRVKVKSDGTIAPYFASTSPPKLKAEPIEAAPIRVTIHELTADSCRWPLGDPSDLDSFRYCGARVDRIGVVSYCAGHVRMAYQPRAT